MIKAVIFDLDGVLVSTDEFHYQAWSQLAAEIGVSFSRKDNEALRGVSRAESLDIILGKSSHAFSEQEKSDMMARKNHCYQGLLSRLSPADILPGVEEFLSGLEGVHIPMAIGSSSKNAPLILEKVGLSRRFKAVADGNLISRSKPDPEVFLLAAQLLMMDPRDCLVVEDAVAGIEAANRAGMKVLGLGHGTEKSTATYHAPSLAGVNPLEYLA